MLLPDIIHFILRLGFRNEIINTGFFCDIPGCTRIIPRHHYRLHPHLAQAFEAFFYARLDNILQFNNANNLSVDADDKRSTSVARHFINNFFSFFGERISRFLGHLADGVKSPLPDFGSIAQINARTLRLRRELDHASPFRMKVAHMDSIFMPKLDN